MSKRAKNAACAAPEPRHNATARPLRAVPELTATQKGYLSIRPSTVHQLDKALEHIQIKKK